MNIGCSSFSWETEDHKHLFGRTYDQFGNLDGNQIAIVPRGYEIKTEISKESTSKAAVKYAFEGMSIPGLHTPIMVDGINEKGLMGALLHYPGYAVYDTQRGPSQTNIHPGFLITYLLGLCSSVAEAAYKIPQINLTNEPIFEKEMTVHYILCDTTGETIIIEPDPDGIRLHRNTLGVMTNSPNYLWHKTNLRNYLGVDNLHKPPKEILGERFTSFGEGMGGGFGLPGDYSSPSRFVRMVFMKQYAVKGRDEIDGVGKMFHNFASVDTPEGIQSTHPEQGLYEQTLCICSMCAESLTYYFSTASNRRILAIDLKEELKNNQLKYYDLHQKQDILYLNHVN